jgi:hypothetical protein
LNERVPGNRKFINFLKRKQLHLPFKGIQFQLTFIGPLVVVEINEFPLSALLTLVLITNEMIAPGKTAIINGGPLLGKQNALWLISCQHG